MIDANVIYSAILFPNSHISKIVESIKENHTLVISDYIIDEIDLVFQEKCADKYIEMKTALNNLADEIFEMTNIESEVYPAIRDIDDLPVLAGAIQSNVDILVTGDKDFDDLKIESPRILKPRQYADEFMT